VLSLGAVAWALPAVADLPAPIDDLQRLFIEDTVGLTRPAPDAAKSRAQALMNDAAAARARGAMSDMRRRLAEARVVLAGEPWSPGAEWLYSLAIRPTPVVLDAATPLNIDIGHYYRSALPAAVPTTFEVGLRRRQAAGGPPADIRWLATAASSAADLLESPLRVVAAHQDFADGTYDLIVRATQGAMRLGETSTRIFVVANLHRDLARLDARAGVSGASKAVDAALAYPADLVKGLNDRTRQVRDVAFRPLLDAALRVMEAAAQGLDAIKTEVPIERFYWLPEAARYEPYSFSLPPGWDGHRPLPLLVVLHGSGGDQDEALRIQGLVAQAGLRGWAVLGPMGYAPNGGWGNHMRVVLANGTMPRPRPSTLAGVVLPADGVVPEPAECDVLRTIAEVRQAYPVDARRIYLLGNSMGGEGVWYLAARYPGLWAAVAAGAGAVDPEHYPYTSLGRLPVLGVHGTRDVIISPAATRAMIDQLRQAGGSATLLSVPDGDHGAMFTVLPDIFDFFARHPRKSDGLARVSAVPSGGLASDSDRP
jgi:poly(3-hydroxybutyrate) depolymerase